MDSLIHSKVTKKTLSVIPFRWALQPPVAFKKSWKRYYLERLELEQNSQQRVQKMQTLLMKYLKFPSLHYMEQVKKLSEKELYTQKDDFLNAYLGSIENEKLRSELQELRRHIYIRKFMRTKKRNIFTIYCKARLYFLDGEYVKLCYDFEEVLNTAKGSVYSEKTAELYYYYIPSRHSENAFDDAPDQSDDEEFERRSIVSFEGYEGTNTNREVDFNEKNLRWLKERMITEKTSLIDLNTFYHFLMVRCAGEEGMVF